MRRQCRAGDAWLNVECQKITCRLLQQGSAAQCRIIKIFKTEKNEMKYLKSDVIMAVVTSFCYIWVRSERN